MVSSLTIMIKVKGGSMIVMMMRIFLDCDEREDKDGGSQWWIKVSTGRARWWWRCDDDGGDESEKKDSGGIKVFTAGGKCAVVVGKRLEKFPLITQLASTSKSLDGHLVFNWSSCFTWWWSCFNWSSCFQLIILFPTDHILFQLINLFQLIILFYLMIISSWHLDFLARVANVNKQVCFILSEVTGVNNSFISVCKLYNE